MDSIRKLVKNKSVLFVGNSVEIMNHKLKKFIDGFDIVVKFGAAIQATKEHQEHIGTRADIWITGQFRSPAYNELKEDKRINDDNIYCMKSPTRISVHMCS